MGIPLLTVLPYADYLLLFHFTQGSNLENATLYTDVCPVYDSYEYNYVYVLGDTLKLL